MCVLDNYEIETSVPYWCAGFLCVEVQQKNGGGAKIENLTGLKPTKI